MKRTNKIYLSIVIIVSIIILTQNQCCVKFQAGICLDCPTGMHLYRNNCIYDIQGCKKYVNGFDCQQCELGYRINPSGKCQTTKININNIPAQGYQEINVTSQDKNIKNIDTINKNSFISQLNNSSIVKIYRVSIDSLLIYRIIYQFSNGYLQTIYSVANNLEPILIDNSKYVVKTGQQWIDFTIDENYELLKQEIYGKYSFLKDAELLGTLKSNLKNIQYYRVYYVSANQGITQVNTAIELTQPQFNPNPISNKTEQSFDLSLLNTKPQFVLGYNIFRTQYLNILDKSTVTYLSKSIQNSQQIYKILFKTINGNTYQAKYKVQLLNNQFSIVSFVKIDNNTNNGSQNVTNNNNADSLTNSTNSNQIPIPTNQIVSSPFVEMSLTQFQLDQYHQNIISFISKWKKDIIKDSTLYKIQFAFFNNMIYRISYLFSNQQLYVIVIGIDLNTKVIRLISENYKQAKDTPIVSKNTSNLQNKSQDSNKTTSLPSTNKKQLSESQYKNNPKFNKILSLLNLLYIKFIKDAQITRVYSISQNNDGTQYQIIYSKEDSQITIVAQINNQDQIDIISMNQQFVLNPQAIKFSTNKTGQTNNSSDNMALNSTSSKSSIQKYPSGKLLPTQYLVDSNFQIINNYILGKYQLEQYNITNVIYTSNGKDIYTIIYLLKIGEVYFTTEIFDNGTFNILDNNYNQVQNNFNKNQQQQQQSNINQQQQQSNTNQQQQQSNTNQQQQQSNTNQQQQQSNTNQQQQQSNTNQQQQQSNTNQQQQQSNTNQQQQQSNTNQQQQQSNTNQQQQQSNTNQQQQQSNTNQQQQQSNTNQQQQQSNTNQQLPLSPRHRAGILTKSQYQSDVKYLLISNYLKSNYGSLIQNSQIRSVIYSFNSEDQIYTIIYILKSQQQLFFSIKLSNSQKIQILQSNINQISQQQVKNTPQPPSFNSGILKKQQYQKDIYFQAIKNYINGLYSQQLIGASIKQVLFVSGSNNYLYTLVYSRTNDQVYFTVSILATGGNIQIMQSNIQNSGTIQTVSSGSNKMQNIIPNNSQNNLSTISSQQNYTFNQYQLGPNQQMIQSNSFKNNFPTQYNFSLNINFNFYRNEAILYVVYNPNTPYYKIIFKSGGWYKIGRRDSSDLLILESGYATSKEITLDLNASQIDKIKSLLKLSKQIKQVSGWKYQNNKIVYYRILLTQFDNSKYEYQLVSENNFIGLKLIKIINLSINNIQWKFNQSGVVSSESMSFLKNQFQVISFQFEQIHFSNNKIRRVLFVSKWGSIQTIFNIQSNLIYHLINIDVGYIKQQQIFKNDPTYKIIQQNINKYFLLADFKIILVKIRKWDSYNQYLVIIQSKKGSYQLTILSDTNGYYLESFKTISSGIGSQQKIIQMFRYDTPLNIEETQKSKQFQACQQLLMQQYSQYLIQSKIISIYTSNQSETIIYNIIYASISGNFLAVLGYNTIKKKPQIKSLVLIDISRFGYTIKGCQYLSVDQNSCNKCQNGYHLGSDGFCYQDIRQCDIYTGQVCLACSSNTILLNNTCALECETVCTPNIYRYLGFNIDPFCKQQQNLICNLCRQGYKLDNISNSCIPI